MLFLYQWRQWEGDSLRLGFSRFVTAARRGARVVREIWFQTMDWWATPDEATAELLGEVLPLSPALESIKFVHCGFSLAHLQLFTSSVSTTATRLANLEFISQPVDRERAQAIADMVRRNVPLSTLSVGDIFSGGLVADNCQLICSSVSRNKNLRSLTIWVKELFADTLDHVAASSSSLLDLTVIVFTPMSDDVVQELARQLRTNTTMARLTLRQYGVPPRTDFSDCFRPIEEVLETYNFTLDFVSLGGSAELGPPPAVRTRIDDLILCNGHIKREFSKLQCPKYRGTRTLRELPIPRVLELAGRLPTIVYRFLRRGEADDLCDLVHRCKSARKRARASPRSEEDLLVVDRASDEVNDALATESDPHQRGADREYQSLTTSLEDLLFLRVDINPHLIGRTTEEERGELKAD